MTSGLAGSMTMALLDPDVCVVTFCCGVVLRLPAAAASLTLLIFSSA
jgi:hypothetical protein